MSVGEQVFALVAKHTKVERSALSRDSVFAELGADSLDIVDMLLAVEDTLDIAIPEEQAAAFKTVGELIAFVEQHATDKAPPVALVPTPGPNAPPLEPVAARAPILLDPPPKHPLLGLLIAQVSTVIDCGTWKYLIILLALAAAKEGIGTAGPAYDAAAQRQASIAFVIVTLPFLLLSLPAGALADRWSKRSILLAMKAVDVVLLAVGTVVLYYEPTGGWAALVVLGLLGTLGAVFSPSLYGLLPEVLPHDRLSAGNGTVQMWTFLAIIAGPVASGLLLGLLGSQVWLAGLLLSVSAAVGFAGAWAIPRVPASGGTAGVLQTVQGAWEAIRADQVLRLSILGSAYYWCLASLLSQDVLIYTKSLELSEFQTTLPLGIFGIGVGVGSILAGKLSASKVEHGLIPIGAAILALGTLLLGALGPGLLGTTLLMVIMGIASGFLVVPLNALIQWRAPSDRRGAVIALSNVVVFAGILAGTLGAGLLAEAGLSPRGILLGAGVLIIGGTLWALWHLPEALLRLILFVQAHTLYRLRVAGREHVPQTGGALLVPNHVSLVDGLFLIASIDRPIRFIVDSTYFYRWYFYPFLRALGAIPISAGQGPLVVLRALKDAGAYLDRGELVCIFAEGELTRTGLLLPFRRGLERIVKGRTAPIIPVHLDRVWGSIFSREGGRFLTKLPRQVPYPVAVTFGTPLAPTTPLPALRQAVQELSAAAWEFRKPDCRPLHHGLIRRARRHPFRLLFADGSRPKVSGFAGLVGAIALALALRSAWEGQERVGILLPPSVAGALANVAAALAGRTSVNLNYTAGPAGMASAVRQAGLRTVLTSRIFLEKARLTLPEGVAPLWIEDIAAGITRGARAQAALLALLPIRLLERLCGAPRRTTVDDIATIIFSSGSTGEPKGVMLSHFNVDSNVQGVAQIYGITSEDRLMGILPLFHSFGYMTLWFAGNTGMGNVFHPNPLEPAAIGFLVERYRATVLLATTTFLQVYLRRCTPAQFGSLRVVLAGAEKLPERVAQAFEDHFGIRPLEGYGATECAPVIAASTLDFRAAGFYQPGSRRGCVGQPLPGIALRVIDRGVLGDDMQGPVPTPVPAPLLPGQEGLLLVKGPNVMTGYLNRDDLTAKAKRDGWYVTGDMAVVDEDGFLRITGRLARFAKVGGEMVPLERVEEALHEAAGKKEQTFAVTAIPDAKKNERLAVLYTLDEASLVVVLERLSASGLPNLWLPRREQFVHVDKLPVLGTGKTDLRALHRIAVEALAGNGG